MALQAAADLFADLQITNMRNLRALNGTENSPNPLRALRP